MKYSILATALLAVALTACDKKEETTPASSDAVTPDQATPVTPSTEAPAPEAAAPAPEAAAPAPEAEAPAAAPATPEPQTAAPADTAPAADAAAPAGAQSAALSLDEGTALAKKSGCFACHNIERKIIGPSWNDVGAKYKGDPAARDAMMKWIHTGGTGRWGTAVMPPYSPRVADADIEKLADFILSLPRS